MPKIPTDNPPCIHCGGATKKNGSTGKAKTPTYLCKACGKSFTGTKRGRPPKKDKPMSSRERSRKYYLKLTPEQRKAYNAKRNARRKRKPPSEEGGGLTKDS